jgi:hypothetical protein
MRHAFRTLFFAVMSASLLGMGCGPTADATGDGGNNNGDGDGGPTGCQGASCQNKCPAGTQTTVRGRVLMPNGIDPVPQALVYVPREVSEFPETVQCEVCDQITDIAIVSTQTADDGSFVLGPIPTAENQAPGFAVQLVAQKGRFRKLLEYTIETPCGENVAGNNDFELPGRTAGFDNIPNIAVADGTYDQMECVLLKLGIEQGAFDIYSGSMDIFGGGGAPGTQGNLDTLLLDLAKMKTYNIIFINCSNNDYEAALTNAAVKNNIRDYVQSGGRLYITDWSYDYIEQVPEFASIIDFGPGVDSNPGQPEPRDQGAMGEGGIETDATVLQDGLRRWLEAVEAVTGDAVIDDQGRVHITHFLAGWVMQSQVPAADNVKVWLEGPVTGGTYTNETLPLTTTFDYADCGRVLYSSYHTEGGGNTLSQAFPTYCASGELTPQERVLEYLILHIADCITVD